MDVKEMKVQWLSLTMRIKDKEKTFLSIQGKKKLKT